MLKIAQLTWNPRDLASPDANVLLRRGPSTVEIKFTLVTLRLRVKWRCFAKNGKTICEIHHPDLEFSMGRATNNIRHGFANQRAQRTERVTRALSIAIPVFAYICRYSFEISRKAKRDLMDFTQCDRLHIDFKL